MRLLFFATFAFLQTSYASIGDSTVGTARQTIVNRLQIEKISDLNFGEASPGEGPKTVRAGFMETDENASFEVSGEQFRFFQIILPDNNTVKMDTAGGGPNKEIRIVSFHSFPHKLGYLNQSGKSMVYVGAHREGISPNQSPGEYSGQFQITVVY
ncbi:DUF4402 domain-containing protein [Bdellovibrio bacteriovorus]|uniref:DUF4402 domain-containing protein n=1 Tax=Bdellovibrio bacteriovorus TaxID=959 RepID=UPI003A7F6638